MDGKQRKKAKKSYRSRGQYVGDCSEDTLPFGAYELSVNAATAGDDDDSSGSSADEPKQKDVDQEMSKFNLYQLSVQRPKGDISYLQKFFLMYVGGRGPLHLQEDFCGTALLSTNWLQSDSRRTAVGLDFDREALEWCLENNLSKIGMDGYSRLFLFHGNVLHPSQAILVNKNLDHLMESLSVSDADACAGALCSGDLSKSATVTFRNVASHARDIVCAFNYSCCCLHKRKYLVSYFKHALAALSKDGGIFVMDLYGGTSSEKKLRLRRKFPGFTYIWEQEDFDIISRQTSISIHFQLGKKQMLRHAFSYRWRLWSLPEIKDCLEEAGFRSIHFWMREMPDTGITANADEYTASRDVKYEEMSSFIQQDAWNAYVVAVGNA